MNLKTTSDVEFDVVIAGGGMVGSMLGAALGGTALRVAILESLDPAPFSQTDAYDLRVSALSLASEKMLKAVGAWQGIVEKRTAPFRYMEVWDGEKGGSTRFDSGEIGEPHLGHIVENRVIQLALHEIIKELPNVEVISPVSLQAARFDNDSVALTIKELGTKNDDSEGTTREITARLLVGADGANSVVRGLAGIGIKKSSYPQQALVASVTTKSPQQNITWQRFLPTGPQALLPLEGSRASMVWYHSADEIARLKALPDEEFLRLMEQEFPDELGELTGISGRGSFPLFCSHADRYVGERVALIGDAAHTVHPLAGQGVNLGLMDAAVLAETLASSSAAPRGRHGGFATRAQLRPYERWRRHENSLMINVLDGFYHAFKPQSAPVQELRSVAMNMAGKIAPLRHLLMQYAMGVQGDLPDLAKGIPIGADAVAPRQTNFR